jgi:hypothetical protein
LLGLSGGASGTGFSAPQAAPIVNPTNAGQIGTAYTGNQGALTSQQQLLQALQAQNGIGNQNQVYSQLQGVANGTGPNPAQAMLAQSTGQNVANQAALAAGQRGASANVGLMARQAAQQGSAAQQNAAGQAATLQANQSLNAINSAGQIAGSQVQNQIGATGANTAAQQAEQAALLQAQQNYNAQLVSGQNNINSTNAGLAGQDMTGQQKVIGGLANSLGGGSSLLGGGSGGGASPAGANADGTVNPSLATAGFMAGGGQVQSFGRHLAMMANGGKVQALVSPGEKFLKPADVEKVKKGANPMKVGETIPGKPKVGGAKNSYANDTVPKKLEEGGIVLPRSVTQSENPYRDAIRFVQATLAKKRSKR